MLIRKKSYPSSVSHAGWIALSILAFLVVTAAPAQADQCITHPSNHFPICGFYHGGCVETYTEGSSNPYCLEVYHRYENLPPFGNHYMRMGISIQDLWIGDPMGESFDFLAKQQNDCNGTEGSYSPVVTCADGDCFAVTDYSLGMSGATDICIEVQSNQLWNGSPEVPNAGQDEAYLDNGLGCSGSDDQYPLIVTTLPDDAEYLAASDKCTSPGSREGSYLDTRTSNNTREALQEGSVAGGKSKLMHVWKFTNVQPGTSQELLIEGYRPNNPDGDNFQFGISTAANPGCTSPFSTISGAVISSPTESSVNYSLGTGGLSGTVWIAVWDTVANGSNLATVLVDKLAIRTIYDCP